MKEKKKILVVDYDRSSLDSLKKIFEKEGYQVYAAKDGEEACAFFFSKKPDLVVLEPFLPRLHGFDFLGKASEKFTKPFPLIVVTGFYSEAICRRDYLSYFDNYAFFNKPYQEKELLQAASRLLHKENGGQDEESQQPEVLQPGVQAAETNDDNFGLPDPLNKVRTELEDLLKLAKERKAKKAGTPELKGEAGMEAKERDDLDLLIKDYLQKLKNEEKESQETFEEDVDEEIESLLEGELSGLLTAKKESPEIAEDKQDVIDEKKMEQKIESLVEVEKGTRKESYLSEEKGQEPPLDKEPKGKEKTEEVRPEEKAVAAQEKKAVLAKEKSQEGEKEQKVEETEKSQSSWKELQETGSLKDKKSEKESARPKESSPSEKAPALDSKEGKKEMAEEDKKDAEVDKAQAGESQAPEVSPKGDEKEKENKDEVSLTFSSSIFDQIESKKTISSFLPIGLGVAGVGVVLTLLFIFLSGKSSTEKSVELVQANLVGQTQKVASVSGEKPAVPGVQANLEGDTRQTSSSSVELKGTGTINQVSPSGEGPAVAQMEVKNLAQKGKTQPANQQSVEPLAIPLETAGVSLKEINPSFDEKKAASSEKEQLSEKEGQTQEGQAAVAETATTRKEEPNKPVTSPAKQAVKINAGDLVPLNLVDKPPQVIEKVMPKYPPQALRFGVKGQVVIMALISENGYVLETRLLRGIEKSFGLNEASLEAVMKWRFKPAEKDGVKVKVWKPISFVFQGKDTS